MNFQSRKNIVSAFSFVEDIDTKIVRRYGTACYIMEHHVFAKYAASAAAVAPRT
jgi:hypothetical protein